MAHRQGGSMRAPGGQSLGQAESLLEKNLDLRELGVKWRE